MVDSKIGKSFSKSVGRAKEKILQNLGKVDRTADEIFDEHVSNFSKQQCAASRLQKELNNYIRCIRACSTANHALLEAVSEIYEPEWGGKELLTVNSQSSEMLWNDFAHRLAEQVLIPLNTYQGQFPEMRKKIEKRGRKLVDFDGERHALQALQSNPRRAEAKLARQRENLEAAKRTYEVLNLELHEELPALYGSRIVFLVSAMSTLFASENIFHSETSKVYADLESIVERLAKESAKGNFNFKSSNAILNNTADSQKDGTSTVSPGVNGIHKAAEEEKKKVDKTNMSLDLKSTNTPSSNHETESVSPSKAEAGVLYRVRATYRYLKEDVDELSFEAGEIIRVVEYDDPEEQEEGWLMGVKDNGEKGMFPANFTRPL
jgi:amphiphysin